MYFSFTQYLIQFFRCGFFQNSLWTAVDHLANRWGPPVFHGPQFDKHCLTCSCLLVLHSFASSGCFSFFCHLWVCLSIFNSSTFDCCEWRLFHIMSRFITQDLQHCHSTNTAIIEHDDTIYNTSFNTTPSTTPVLMHLIQQMLFMLIAH